MVKLHKMHLEVKVNQLKVKDMHVKMGISTFNEKGSVKQTSMWQSLYLYTLILLPATYYSICHDAIILSLEIVTQYMSY